jgi:hypothetical protein
VEEINKRNRLLIHFQYGIYNSPIPAPFIRAVPVISHVLATPSAPSSPQRRQVLQATERLLLVVTSEIATGATGVVHGGTLEVELPGQCLTLEVVSKFAFTDQQQEDLAHEHSIYRYLISKGVTGIATPLGLFNSFEDGPSALLMTYNGIPLVIVNTQSHLLHGQFLLF